MKDRLPEGKVPWDLIAEHLGGVLGEDVPLGPGAGEDAALVRIGGETWAIAADPISFTASDAGRLSVLVNANDVAVRGAQPRFFLATVLVAPEEASVGQIRALLGQIRSTCERLGVALIGGHTEVTPGLPHSMVAGTMLGPVLHRPITTGGLQPGDRIGMTKWAGLEGTSILLAELGAHLRRLDGDDSWQADTGLCGDWLSVVPEALLAAANPFVTALHDVTEGGVGEALYELGRASGLFPDVSSEQVPLLPLTRRLCCDLGINPLGLIGSGALLVGCREEGCRDLEEVYRQHQIPFAWIGRAGSDPSVEPGPPRFERDEILKTWYLAETEAVVFDMDGTLVDSEYDWPAIRDQLGISGPSIIDALNGLPSPEREDKWALLCQAEDQATRNAGLKEGARQLLVLLREQGLHTALVTNNREHNTRWLLERFGLSFDVVLTRDSGLWKPSGAPLAAAAQRLGVPPQQCLMVGDSSLDLTAARDAGYGRTCAVYGAAQRCPEAADLVFPDLTGLLRYCRIVLTKK
jgi:HAD superfamily hydrolase (TIGR01509 family)